MIDRTGAHAGSRSQRLEARIPAGLKSMFARAAALRGQTLTDFVLTAAAEAAERAIREREVLDLSERDQVAFARNLLRPPPPARKLKEAARGYGRRPPR